MQHIEQAAHKSMPRVWSNVHEHAELSIADNVNAVDSAAAAIFNVMMHHANHLKVSSIEHERRVYEL
jgi:hypothetical protein